MSDWTALAVIAVAMFGFFAAAKIFGETPADKNREIAIECVKAGNEWVSNWGVFECVRKEATK